jgi:hypothetical protein
MVPELIRTNRQIIEQMHNLNRAHEESRAAALRAEELHRAGIDAAAAQNREAHERTMNLFREALHPHAQAIAAMHAGAASLHTAAQDIRDAATMQRAMAGSSSDIFLAAIREGLEAIRAQRPDEAPFAGPQQQPSAPFAGPEVVPQRGSLDSAMQEEHAKPKRNLSAAVRSASRGAAAASSQPMPEQPAQTYGSKIGVDFGGDRPRTPSQSRHRGSRSPRAKKVVVEPHDESGAVITGEPNSIVRVEPPLKQRRTTSNSAGPKARSASATRVTPGGSSSAVQINARSPSAPRVTPGGSKARGRAPSVARGRTAVRTIALDA